MTLLFSILFVIFCYFWALEYRRQKRMCWPQAQIMFLDPDMKLGYLIYKLGKRIRLYTNYLQEPYRYMSGGRIYESRGIEPKRRKFGLQQANTYKNGIRVRLTDKVRFNPANPRESYLLMGSSHLNWLMIGLWVLAIFAILIWSPILLP